MIVKGVDPRELAVDLLNRSICAVQVAAVLADKHGIFSWGWNGAGPNPGYGMHAEAHCLLRANRKRTEKATLYVAAQRNRNQKPVTAKPCPQCEDMIKWAKVEKVVFRSGDERWIEL